MYTRGRCRWTGVTCLRKFALFVCGVEWESRRNTSLCMLEWRDFISVVSGWFLLLIFIHEWFCCWFLPWELLAEVEKLREEAEKLTFRRNFLRFWAQILWFETYTNNFSSELRREPFSLPLLRTWYWSCITESGKFWGVMRNISGKGMTYFWIQNPECSPSYHGPANYFVRSPTGSWNKLSLGVIYGAVGNGKGRRIHRKGRPNCNYWDPLHYKNKWHFPLSTPSNNERGFSFAEKFEMPQLWGRISCHNVETWRYIYSQVREAWAFGLPMICVSQ